jgi:lipoprotein-anchoring transpeptidase ErfK/SrfK
MREHYMTVAARVRAAIILAAAMCLTVGLQGAQANRFGPPWQARVVVDQATVFSQPDRAAPAVGPLDRGALVAVTGEVKAADGTDWTAIPDGFVLSSDIAEDPNPWIAEVSAPSVSVYAKPNAAGQVRRTAKAGDLLRVTGMSPGLDGDTGIWWATTDGYVALHTIRAAGSEWAAQWALPSADEAPRGWWGGIRSQANVRAGATTDAPIVGGLVPGDRVKVLAEEQGEAVNGNPTWYRIDGGRYAGGRVHASLVNRLPDPRPVVSPKPADSPPGPWLVVDRSTATLTLVGEDGQPAFTTFVSLGRAGVETPDGAYGTIGKYKADDMTSTSVSDADRTYDLPNVPFTQYYRLGGYALHGTYWHDHFGGVESQGCINLTWADSAYLFALTKPDVAPEDNARWATGDLVATPLEIRN